MRRDRDRGRLRLLLLGLESLVASERGRREPRVHLGDLVVLEKARDEQTGGHQRDQRQPDEHDGKLVTEPQRRAQRPSLCLVSIIRIEPQTPRNRGGNDVSEGIRPRPPGSSSATCPPQYAASARAARRMSSSVGRYSRSRTGVNGIGVLSAATRGTGAARSWK